MSITAVRAYLAQFGLDSKVLEFPVSSATCQIASWILQEKTTAVGPCVGFGRRFYVKI